MVLGAIKFLLPFRRLICLGIVVMVLFLIIILGLLLLI